MDTSTATVTIGLPLERLGKHCCARMVPQAGQQSSLEQGRGHLAEAGLTKYKLAERPQLRVELPSTVSEKIQRHRRVAAYS